MKKPTYKSTYKKNLEIGFSASLLLFCFMFYFIRGNYTIGYNPKNVELPVIVILDIPQTNQVLSKPKPQQPIIASYFEEVEYLEDVTIKMDSTFQLAAVGHDIITMNSNDLPLQPRQILEVLPQKTAQDVNGVIKLSLLIDAKGHVKQNKILTNTTASPECLENVLFAAQKSRWQPIQYNGRKVEYWIEKSYIFE